MFLCVKEVRTFICSISRNDCAIFCGIFRTFLFLCVYLVSLFNCIIGWVFFLCETTTPDLTGKACHLLAILMN